MLICIGDGIRDSLEIEILTTGSIFGEVYICLAILWLGEINAPS